MDFNKALEIIQEGSKLDTVMKVSAKKASEMIKNMYPDAVVKRGTDEENEYFVGKELVGRYDILSGKLFYKFKKSIDEAIMTPQQKKVYDQAKTLAKQQLLAKKKLKPGEDIEPEDVNDLKKGWKKIDKMTQLKAKQAIGSNIRLT